MTEVISDNNTSQTDDLSDAAQLTIGEPCQSEGAYKEIGKKASAVTGNVLEQGNRQENQRSDRQGLDPENRLPHHE